MERVLPGARLGVTKFAAALDGGEVSGALRFQKQLTVLGGSFE